MKKMYKLGYLVIALGGVAIALGTYLSANKEEQ